MIRVHSKARNLMVISLEGQKIDSGITFEGLNNDGKLQSEARKLMVLLFLKARD